MILLRVRHQRRCALLESHFPALRWLQVGSSSLSPSSSETLSSIGTHRLTSSELHSYVLYSTQNLAI